MKTKAQINQLYAQLCMNAGDATRKRQRLEKEIVRLNDHVVDLYLQMEALEKEIPSEDPQPEAPQGESQ